MKSHSPEYYEAYRNRVIEIISTSHPLLGQVQLRSIEHWRALIVASHFYDTSSIAQDDNGSFVVMTRGGKRAIVGTLDGSPAILYRCPDGSPGLSILKTNF